MPNNYQRSHEFAMQKLSKTAQDISKGVSNISNEDLIEYLELQKQEQQKRDNLNLFFTVLNTLISIGALIGTFIPLIHTFSSSI